MSSAGISMSGLISGLDSASLIKQLMAVERKPIERMQTKISSLEAQRTAIRSLRTQLQTLRSRSQDFRFNTVFTKYAAKSSDEDVLTSEVSGQNPVSGSYKIDVTRLASATTANSSASLGGKIDPAAALNSSGLTSKVTGTKFTVNGVDFTFDPDTQSLNDVIGMINSSSAGVTASYDSATDMVTLANTAAGDTSLINLAHSKTDDTANSNIMDALNLSQATQATNGSGSTALTSTHILGAVDPSKDLGVAGFGKGAVTSGTFSINGVSISIDVTKDSLSDVIGRINKSNAQVTASYDSATDTVRFVSKVMGSRTIRFTSGTSNFLDMANLTNATQTAGNDSQFSINNGPVQTRNSNSVTDALGGVTLKFLDTGTSTVTVDPDEEGIVEGVKSFVTTFNDTVAQLESTLGEKGAAAGDGALRLIESYIRTTVFNRVDGVSGEYDSLAQIGITTGDSFDSSAVPKLELDEDAFLKAFRENKDDVVQLFSNEGKTGIADQLFSYLDGVTSTTGFLNQRVKSNGTIDEQIKAYNKRITEMEARVEKKEQRLKAQFTRLEQMSASYQSQSAALSRL
jgi:flagellar hook-associated protein 2